MQVPFRIQVLDAYGNPLGSGPLLTVQTLDDTRSLDEVGSLSFSFIPSEPRSALITPGCQFEVYDEQDGYLGRYVFQTDVLSDILQNPTLSVTAYDLLVELRRQLVGFNRSYSGTAVETIIAELVALAPSWSSVVDASLGNAAVDYQGESVLRSLDELRQRWGLHYRLSPTRVLEFGAFGDISDVVLTNLTGQVASVFDSNTNVAVVTSIKRKRTADELFNQIIPLSSGQGQAQFTIEGAVLGTRTVLNGVNADSSLYYYIQDDASVSEYGGRMRIVQFPSIRPVSNNATDVQYAREMLKIAGEAYLLRSKDPIIGYDVMVQGLRQDIRPGDKVRLKYKGATPEGVYLDVDEVFWVMGITRQRRADGKRAQTLKLVNTDVQERSDTNVVVDVVRDLQTLRLHVQPNPFWSENTWDDTVQGDSSSSGPNFKAANFKVEIDNSVTAVTKVRIRFKTFPLYATALVTTSVVFNAVYDGIVMPHYNYPYNMSLFINGEDVTSEYGGPWGDGSNPVDVILDITDKITGATGGLHQDHSIVFEAAARSGDVNFPGYTASASSYLASSGHVQLNVRVQGVTQAIIPS